MKVVVSVNVDYRATNGGSYYGSYQSMLTIVVRMTT